MGRKAGRVAPRPVSWVGCHHWTARARARARGDRGAWWAGSLEPLAHVVGPGVTSLKAFCSWASLCPPPTLTPNSILLLVSGVSFL